LNPEIESTDGIFFSAAVPYIPIIKKIWWSLTDDYFDWSPYTVFGVSKYNSILLATYIFINLDLLWKNRNNRKFKNSPLNYNFYHNLLLTNFQYSLNLGKTLFLPETYKFCLKTNEQWSIDPSRLSLL